MRSWSLILLLLGCASCIVRVQPPPGVRISVNTNATVRANARVEAPQPPPRVTVTMQTPQAPPPPRPPEPPQPPPPPPEPVALQGAPVVEFFGIPLEGAGDVVFVLDCSGSMTEAAPGALAQLKSQDAPAAVPSKIDVARAELVDAIQRLPAGTLMNVIFFNNGVGAFAASMVALEEGGRDALVSFVRELGATGRTALAPAMRTAFLMNARRIVLLSDGLGNVGGGSDDLLRDAREALRGGVRIDTIGLGSDQDAALLRTLAGESGGLYQPL